MPVCSSVGTCACTCLCLSAGVCVCPCMCSCWGKRQEPGLLWLPWFKGTGHGARTYRRWESHGAAAGRSRHARPVCGNSSCTCCSQGRWCCVHTRTAGCPRALSTGWRAGCTCTWGDPERQRSGGLWAGRLVPEGRTAFKSVQDSPWDPEGHSPTCTHQFPIFVLWDKNAPISPPVEGSTALCDPSQPCCLGLQALVLSLF
jgi:hypothetical protein